MKPPIAKDGEANAVQSRPTFRFAPHTDIKNLGPASSTASDKAIGTIPKPKTSVQPIIPARTDSISIQHGKLESEGSKTAVSHCSLCSAKFPHWCPIHEAGSRASFIVGFGSTTPVVGQRRHDNNTDTTNIQNAGQACPPTDTKNTSKAVKTDRSHEENQKRAYIANSRRPERSIESRLESARRASEIHKKRAGRALRVTLQDVVNEEMFEEEEEDLPPLMRAFASLRGIGSTGSTTYKSPVHSSSHIRTNPDIAKAVKAEPATARASSSSSDSSGRMTPESVGDASASANDSHGVSSCEKSEHVPTIYGEGPSLAFEGSRTVGSKKIAAVTQDKGGHGSKNTHGYGTCDCFTDARITVYGQSVEGNTRPDYFEVLTLSQRFVPIILDINELLADACNNDNPALHTIREINHHIHWLWADLRKHLREDKMLKTNGSRDELLGKENKTAREKAKETEIEKQSRLQVEILNLTLDQHQDNLKESRERAKGYVSPMTRLAEREPKRKEEEKEKEQTTAIKKASKTFVKWIEFYKEAELKQNAVDKNGDSSQASKMSFEELHKDVAAILENGADKEKRLAEWMVKSAVKAQNPKQEKTVEEQHKTLDGEIAILKKVKFRQELECAVADNEKYIASKKLDGKRVQEEKEYDERRTAAESTAMKLAKEKSEESFWGGFDLEESIALVVVCLVFVLPVVLMLIVMIWSAFFTLLVRIF